MDGTPWYPKRGVAVSHSTDAVTGPVARASKTKDAHDTAGHKPTISVFAAGVRAWVNGEPVINSFLGMSSFSLALRV